ncbi:hypothetical protein DPSP01_010195 [Paraphaeosphaeria sporulosa]|uniref:Rhodopsin domain-containing protein n=1 Tax=Paraphaeosphaeria sporulosa TaxID=1460663 RepID=A0A177C5U1_9PLEO|nr:uncharacterized protein CC84DRAFT_1098051 [Paraphaeosphaeria sporulosa]OAG03124.1 hypothetical protein CC84DRAFT_1098051 [Paraphaeosphaeria sporulosa]
MSRLEPESGIWYATCWLVLITRLISRKLHHGSWKALGTDDYLICVAMISMTVLMGAMHIVVRSSSNLIAPGEDISKFSADEIQRRIYGSKLVLVVEQMQCITIWLVKACLLLMYKRMTALLPQHKIVMIVSIYTALGFVVMEILYLGVWCRPFNQYWAVPPSNPQCSAATNHLITNAVLNISSDIMIIAIPMPLLFKVKLPKKNKAILIGIFLIGTFNIVAAVLNKYYSFSHPFGDEWTEWYLRESYTAFLCANLPLTYPLVQRIFRLKSWSHNSYDGRYLSGSLQRSAWRSGAVRSQRKSRIGLKSNPQHGGISKTVSVNVSNSRSIHNLERSESEERIYGPPTSRIELEQKAFDGRTEQHLWVPSVTIEMGSTSPTSAKAESMTTTGSIKSLDEAHVKQ